MRYLLAVILVFFTSCCRVKECMNFGCREPVDVDFEDSDHSSVDVDGIIFALTVYSVELNKTQPHQLVLDDSRIFYNNGFVEKIWLRFITQDISEIWDSRKLLTDIVEGWLKRFNEDAFLRTNALGGTLTPFNIDVSIAYQSFYGRYINPLMLGSTIMQDGMVYYYAWDTFDPQTDIWHQRVEPYSKSLLLITAKTQAELPYWEKRRGMEEKMSILGNILSPPGPKNGSPYQNSR